MNRFFEDSSQAKILSKDKDIHRALRNMGNKCFMLYQLRQYQRDGSYIMLDVFTNRKAAEVAKSFADIRLGSPTAIVAVNGG